MNKKKKVTVSNSYRQGKSISQALLFLKHIKQCKNTILIGYGYVVLPTRRYEEIMEMRVHPHFDTAPKDF